MEEAKLFASDDEQISGNIILTSHFSDMLDKTLLDNKSIEFM